MNQEKSMPPTPEPRCPRCGGDTHWEKQDGYRIGKHIFIERMQVCSIGGCWYGRSALFPASNNPPMESWTVLDDAGTISAAPSVAGGLEGW